MSENFNGRGTPPAERDPRIVTQPDSWSCYACVAAMACGETLQDVIDFVGHDGSAIDFSRTSHPEGRVGFSYKDIFNYMSSHGLMFGGWLGYRDGEVRLADEFNDMSKFCGELVVESERLPTCVHSVFWTGSEVLDPNYCNPRDISDYTVICVNPLTRVWKKETPKLGDDENEGSTCD